MQGTERRLQNVAERMRMRGYRITPQRTAIPHVLLNRHDHPIAEDFCQPVATRFPMMSRATAYRTLNILKPLGEVIELQMEACRHYDGNATPHPHLTCVECHNIVDLPSAAMPEPSGGILADTSFRILGLCPECQTHKKQLMSKSNQRKENL